MVDVLLSCEFSRGVICLWKIQGADLLDKALAVSQETWGEDGRGSDSTAATLGDTRNACEDHKIPTASTQVTQMFLTKETDFEGFYRIPIGHKISRLWA